MKVSAVSGHRIRKREPTRHVLTIVCGIATTVAFFLLGGADRLARTVELHVEDGFFGAALAAEMSFITLPSYSELLAAQSVVLQHGYNEEQTDTPSMVRETQPLHDYAPPSSVAQNDASVSAEQLPECAADHDENVKSITAEVTAPNGYDGVYITNNTKYDIDVQSYVESEPEVLREAGVKVLIVHSHASEAYYPHDYTPTDVDRTEDTDYNVVHLGDMLTEILQSHGVDVVHLRDIFDYPTYNGSYTRTLSAIEKTLDEHPGINMVIDLHRDAMIASDGTKYRAVTTVDGRRAAQLMFVMGTDQGGLKHPEWRKNLTTAVHIQKAVVNRYPALCRPISLTKSRYNQHATPGSMILEVGTSANMMDEAEYSVELFGNVLGEFLSNFTAVG